MKPVIKCNDNLEELKKIPNESVDLVYIDPPFDTGTNRGYKDRWSSKDDYIAFMKPRVQEIHRVLKPTGSFYLHSDWHSDSHLRLIADKIFGEGNYHGAIKWKRTKAKNLKRMKSFPVNTDTILFYTKGNDYTFNTQYKPLSEKHVKAKYRHDDGDGRGLYYLAPIERQGGYHYDLGMGERPPGRGYSVTKDEMLRLIESGEAVIRKGKLPRKKLYLNERPGVPVDDVWDDINHVRKAARESVDYPTQKPEALLERVILTSSNPDDIVLDAFAGSGTTCAVAKKLGRKSICIDRNPKACRIMKERMA